MQQSLDLTRILALRAYPNATPLPKRPISSRALKKIVWLTNLFWVICLVGGCFALYSTYLVILNYENKNLQAANRLKELDEEIQRLQSLNLYTSAQTLTLAKSMQMVIDSSDGKRREFLQSVVPEAMKLQITHGVPASATVGMAIYESRYGTSDLAITHHNLFGIKAFEAAWDGPKTYEHTVDRGVPTMAYFRSYPDIQSGILGYAQFLRASDRYKEAFKYKSGDKFVETILAAGYCPDKDYLSNVKTIMERHHLASLDLPENTQATASNTSTPANPVVNSDSALAKTGASTGFSTATN